MYDPNQPRDWRGRWTPSGAAEADPDWWESQNMAEAVSHSGNDDNVLKHFETRMRNDREAGGREFEELLNELEKNDPKRAEHLDRMMRARMASQSDIGERFRNELHKLESISGANNGYEATNDGAYGRYQMRSGALEDTGYMDKNGQWTGKNGIRSADDFLKRPDVQEKAFSEYMKKTKGYLDNHKAFKHDGQKIDGIKAQITVTESGLLAAAHRQGAGIVNEYLEHQNAHGWKSDASTFPSHRHNAFLSVETRLREFQNVPFRE